MTVHGSDNGKQGYHYQHAVNQNARKISLGILLYDPVIDTTLLLHYVGLMVTMVCHVADTEKYVSQNKQVLYFP